MVSPINHTAFFKLGSVYVGGGISGWFYISCGLAEAINSDKIYEI